MSFLKELRVELSPRVLTLFLLLGGLSLSHPSFGLEKCQNYKKWEDCSSALRASSNPQPEACKGFEEYLLNGHEKGFKSSSASPSPIVEQPDDTQEVEYQAYSATIAKAQLIQLTQVADSRVIDAQLGRKVDNLAKKDFTSPVLQEKISSIYKNVSYTGTLQVQPGEVVPSSEKLPGSGPLVRDPDLNCVRPALSKDWKPNSNGYLPILTLPSGFKEIGLMFSRDEGNTAEICGFVLIHPQWAVTEKWFRLFEQQPEYFK